MSGVRVFLGLGADEHDAMGSLVAALRELDRDGDRVVAAARPRWTPYRNTDGSIRAGAEVLNTVVEVRTQRSPGELLARTRALEAKAGRVRDGRPSRALDIDLLAHGSTRVDQPGLKIPHPRALDRAFVLDPWLEIAPLLEVVAHDGTARPVVSWAARLWGEDPTSFDGFRVEEPLPFGAREGQALLLPDRAALQAWREAQRGVVGMVPTMGALHAGHGSLMQRAAAECDAVVATIFVNPLQFGPGEGLQRYPRTLEADRALLRQHGVDAVYVPTADDLYGEDFSTYVVPDAMAATYEGAVRPGHFRGVLTVVTKLWMRCAPDRAYFARKDAQQLALIQRMARDLDLPGCVIPCPTVHEGRGLALSSRNRFLDEAQRDQALGLSHVLRAMAASLAQGVTKRTDLVEKACEVLRARSIVWDYIDVVDAERMTPMETIDRPALAVGTIRVGDVRLLDNRWIAPGGGRP